MEGWSVLSGDLLHFFAHGVPGMSAAHRDCIALPVWSFLHRLPPEPAFEQLFQEVAQRCGTCYYPLELKAILSLLDFFSGTFWGLLHSFSSEDAPALCLFPAHGDLPPLL